MTATRARPRLTDEERAEKCACDRELAQQAVVALVPVRRLAGVATTRSRFHRYSLGNQLLVASQHPRATVSPGSASGSSSATASARAITLSTCGAVPPSKKQIEEAKGERRGSPADVLQNGARLRQVISCSVPGCRDARVGRYLTADDRRRGQDLEPGGSRASTSPESDRLEVSRLVDRAGVGATTRGHGATIGLRESLSRMGASRRWCTSSRSDSCAPTAVRRPSMIRASRRSCRCSIAFGVTGTHGLAGRLPLPYLRRSTNTDEDELEQTAKLIDRLASLLEDASGGGASMMSAAPPRAVTGKIVATQTAGPASTAGARFPAGGVRTRVGQRFGGSLGSRSVDRPAIDDRGSRRSCPSPS